MTKKKMLALALAGAVLLGLAGCSGPTDVVSADPEASASVFESEGPDVAESGLPVVGSEPVTNGDGQEDPNPVDTGNSSSGDSSGSGGASGTGNSSNSGNSGSGSSGSGSSGSGSSGSGSSGSGSSGSGSSGSGSSGSGSSGSGSSGSGSSGSGSSGSGSSGTGGSGSGGSGSGSSPAPTPTPTPKPSTNPSPSPSPSPSHTHNWVDIIETVYHEEVGHYETQEWDEPIYEEKVICNGCGSYFDTVLEVDDHIWVVHNGGTSYYVGKVKTGTIHHSEEVWVVDEAAWEQQVVVGRKCTICGEVVMY